MPLTAVIDGETVCTLTRAADVCSDLNISHRLLRRDELDEMHKKKDTWRATCRTCGQRLLLKSWINRPEFFLFAHWPGTAEACRMLGGGDESFEHNDLKIHLAMVGSRAGYEAGVEVPGDGCRADVVWTKKSSQTPFEVQLASISRADVAERARRYERSFSHQSAWIHHGHSRWAHDVPSMRLETPEANAMVVGGIYADNRLTTRLSVPLDEASLSWARGDLMWIEGTVDEPSGMHPVASTPRPQQHPRRRPNEGADPDIEPLGGAVFCRTPAGGVHGVTVQPLIAARINDLGLEWGIAVLREARRMAEASGVSGPVHLSDIQALPPEVRGRLLYWIAAKGWVTQ